MASQALGQAGLVVHFISCELEDNTVYIPPASLVSQLILMSKRCIIIIKSIDYNIPKSGEENIAYIAANKMLVNISIFFL
jgi:hypothetical protein